MSQLHFLFRTFIIEAIEIIIHGLLIIFICFTPKSLVAETITLHPAQDASVAHESPNTNFNYTYLFSGWATEDWDSAILTYMQFDIPSELEGSTINSVVLSFYTHNYSPAFSGGDVFLNVLKVTGGSWNESTLTWNNKPEYTWDGSESLEFGYVGWWNWDWNPTGNMRDMVQAWADDPNSNYGLVIEADEDGVCLAEFHSSEYSISSLIPKLVIDYSNAQVNPPTLNAITPNPSYSGNYNVSWSEVSGADSYELEWDDNSTFSSPENATFYSTTYGVIEESLGIHYYRVKAVGGGQSSEWSNTQSVEVKGLAPPSGLSVSGDQTEIVLTWTDNSSGAHNEDGFYIFESATGNVNDWMTITTVNADVTSYVKQGIPYGTTQYYAVRAFSSSYNNSDLSSSAEINWEPYLVNASISPEQGRTSDTFTFQVTYLDGDNESPAFANVHVIKSGSSTEISNSPIEMSSISGSPSVGEVYSISLSEFQSGEYYCYFSFQNESSSLLREPATDGLLFSVSPEENLQPHVDQLDISGPMGILYQDIQYTVLTKYYDEDGAIDLHYCYLKLQNPTGDDLTLMWNQNTGSFSTWAGQDGEDYLLINDVQATMMGEGENGYEIVWKFTINSQWQASTEISYGVMAEDDAGAQSGWQYSSETAVYSPNMWFSEFYYSWVMHNVYSEEEESDFAEGAAEFFSGAIPSGLLHFGLGIATGWFDFFLGFFLGAELVGGENWVKSYVKIEDVDVWQNVVHITVGEEVLPLLIYHPSPSEPNWHLGIDLHIEKKVGLFSWESIIINPLVSSSEASTTYWPYSNEIIPKTALSFQTPGIYRVNGDAKIVVNENTQEITPPICNILAPNSGGIFNNSISVEATASDNVSVSYVEFQFSFDQNIWHVLPCGNSDDPANDAKDWYIENGWGFEFHTHQSDEPVDFQNIVEASTIWVRARAVDAVGNMSTWDESDVPFMVDNQNPDLEMITQQDLYFTDNPGLEIHFTDNLGLGDIYYQIDGSQSMWNPLTVDGNTILPNSQNNSGLILTTDWYLHTSTWSSLTPGQHYIYFKITDDAGNIYITPNNTEAFSFIKNASPIVSDIPNQLNIEGVSHFQIDLNQYVNDPDNTDSEISWSYTASGLDLNIANGIAFIVPNDDWFGSETITFTATDPGGLSDSDPVTFTVSPVNDEPTLANIPDPAPVDENAGPQSVSLSGIGSGASNEVQALTLSVSSSNPSLIPLPSIDYSSPNTTGSLTYTPVPNTSGTAVITVTVIDDGGTTNGGDNSYSTSFTIVVNPVNGAPILTELPDQVVLEGSTFNTLALDGYVSDTDNVDAEISWTNAGENELSISIVNRTATISIPNDDWFGSETITFTATDPGGLSDSDPVTFTVSPVNDEPTMANIPDPAPVDENAGVQTVSLSGIGSGASNEVQALTLSVSSSNPSLIPLPTIDYSSPNTTGSLTYTPVPNTSGSAVITVTVTDDGGTANGGDNTYSTNFTVVVNPIDTSPPIPPETGTVPDVDGNIYQTVKIGDQWWMAENLKVTSYRNGEAIDQVNNGTVWSNTVEGAYCYFNNDQSNVDPYGLLYNFYTIEDPRGIAPEGYRVPTDDDWKELEQFLGIDPAELDNTGLRGTDEGGKLKEQGTSHWTEPNTSATNETGFSAVPGSNRNPNGNFDHNGIPGLATSIWTSTEDGPSSAVWRTLYYHDARIERYSGYSGGKGGGLTIRCVMDAPQFTATTSGPVVESGGYSYAANWVDIDADADLDLFVSNTLNQNDQLFINDGNGSFSQVSSGALVTTSGNSLSATWGDYDNDGDEDCFVANHGSGGAGQDNYLYRNDSGSFTRITSGIIVNDTDNGADSYAANWIDYDNDGNLDLFVANDNSHADYLYKGDGSGGFEKITTGDLVTEEVNHYGTFWVDADLDGDLDVYLNGYPDQFHENNSDGTFTKRTDLLMVADSNSVTSFVDYDNDGDFDAFHINVDPLKPNRLWRNDGNWSFTQINSGALLEAGLHRLFANWGDFDNDGNLDVFIPCGGGGSDVNKLYQNLGNGEFERIYDGDITNTSKPSIGAAWADYSGDGYLDLIVTNRNNVSNDLFLNNGGANRWLQVDLIGTISNRSAIGALVEVKATINGTPIWQTRQLSSQDGRFGQTDRLHYGLGDATIIDSIIIKWPSGIVWDSTNVPTSQLLTIVEPNIPQDLIAWYPLDNDALDYSGNGNNGINYSALPTNDRHGNEDGAYVFDGIDDYIGLPDNLLSQHPSLSFFSWVKISDYGNGGSALSASNGGGCDELIHFQSDGDYVNQLNVVNNPGSIVTTQFDIPLDQWLYVGATYDGVTFTSYLNGVAIGTKVLNGGATAYVGPVAIGRRACGIYEFKGSIDDVRLYEKALTAEEILEQYQANNWNPAPLIPKDLQAIAGNAEISLNWNSVPDHDLAKYRIYRGLSSQTKTLYDSVLVSSNPDTLYSDHNVIDRTSYYYQLTAVDDSGLESDFSSEVSFRFEQLVAYYPFTGNAIDSSGNGHDGTVFEASLTSDRFVNTNAAYNFDGSNDKIVIQNSPELVFTNTSFSVSAFVYPENTPPARSYGTHSHILSKTYGDGNSIGRNYQLDFTRDDDTHGWFLFAAGPPGVYSAESFEINDYYHVVGVADFEIDSMRIYVNGTLQGTRSLDEITPSDGPLILGYGEPAAHFFYFDGQIDDVSIFKKALTQSEIDSIYTSRGWPSPAVPQNLAAEAGNEQVALTWNSVADSDLAKYRIYRDTSSPAEMLYDSVLVFANPNTFYNDDAVQNGIKYYYRITAVDSFDLASEFSAEVFTTPAYQHLTVKTDGTGNYSSIQAAINASMDGDTVLVYPGSYVENINYSGKSIVVASRFLTTADTSFILNTIIDGNDNGSTVVFINGESSASKLVGITVQNGNSIGSPYGQGDPGGGIYSDVGCSPVIANCIIRNNNAGAGGGINCHNATLITDCTLYGNTATSTGGGVYTESGSVILKNSRLYDNEAGEKGGGIEARGLMMILNCLIYQNIEGGINSTFNISTVFVKHCTVVDNIGDYEVQALSGATITIQNSIVSGNGLNSFSENEPNSEINASNSILDLEWAGTGNLNLDPVFVEREAHNYQLSDFSPALGNGDPTININPDLLGTVRPSPAGSFPDAGAIESIRSFPLPPEAPTNLAIQEGNTSLTLSWDASVTPTVDRYYIYRSTIQGFTPTQVTDTLQSVATMEFKDSGLANDTTYYYLVSAVDALGNEGALSSEVSGTPGNQLYTVKTDGSGDYTVIQTAINATTDGDTVLVYPGIFVENINFNGHDIVLGSLFLITQDTSYITSTVIDGNQNGSVVTFVSGEPLSTKLTGLLITNGKKNVGTDNWGGCGGGIYITGSSPTIDGCIIRENSAHENGSGVFCRTGNPIIQNTSIENNQKTIGTTGRGGGLYFGYGSSPQMRNVIVRGNTAINGGGIACDNFNTTFENVMVINNIATGNGGGIYIEGQVKKIANCDILSNVGGGIYCAYYDVTVNVFNSIIWENDTYQISGGADWENNSARITFSTVSGSWNGESNLNLNPQFDETAVTSHLLTEYSPCIGSGADSVQIDGIWYYAPNTDISGNLRPTPEGSSPDMGAYEHVRSTPLPPEEPTNLAVQEGNTNLSLSWDASITQSTDRYYIYRSTTQGFVPTMGTDSLQSVSTTFFHDTGLINDTTYYYMVSAVDALGNEGDFSSVASGTPATQLYTVKTDGSGDYRVIQTAIEATTDGDTLLVYPGTYVENINFNGHNIIVGSLFLTTQDTSYISQTVIDGDQSGSVVTFQSGEGITAKLIGFTIQNGTGTLGCDDLLDPTSCGDKYYHGGGIVLYQSSPTLSFLNIISNSVVDNGLVKTWNTGGGIYAWYSNGNLMNLVLSNNEAGFGGGIQVRNSDLLVQNCSITGNTSWATNTMSDGRGSGINLQFSAPTISNCLIANNIGTALNCDNSSNPLVINCTIVDNIGSEGGGIYFAQNSSIDILNSIVVGNQGNYQSGNNIFGCIGTVTVSHSIVEGGFAEISGNCGDPPISPTINWGVGNFDVDPLFQNVSVGNYSLTDYSPCLGAGLDTSIIPLADIDGNLRPSPVGSNPDIGAYEHVRSTPLPPMAPTNLAVEEGNRILSLNWSPSATPTATKYFIYRNRTQGFTPTQVVDTLASTTDTLFFDAGLTNDTTYFYLISAVDALDNEGEFSAEIAGTPINHTPAITSLNTVEATEDMYFRYVATGTDVEDSTLTWSFTDLPAWLSWDADSVYGTPLEGDFDTSFVAMVSDGELSDTLTVDISVLPVNDPPSVASALPDTTVLEDAGDLIIDIAGVFSDVDVLTVSDSLVYSLDAARSDELAVMDLSSTLLTLSFQANQHGIQEVILTATDDSSAAVMDTFYVNILPVNDTPFVFSAMGDVVVDEDAAADVFDVSGVFADVDIETTDDSLRYSVLSGDPSLVTATLDDTELTFGYFENITGSTEVYLTATDDSLATAVDTIAVTIEAVNDAPVLSAFTDTSFYEDTELFVEQAQLFSRVADPDDADMSLTWQYLDQDSVTVTSLNDTLFFNSPLNWYGSDTLQVVVSDTSLSDTTSWVISVLPVNDVPVLTSAATDTVYEDMAFSYTATGYDVDSDISIWFEGLPGWTDSSGTLLSGIPGEGVGDTSFTVIASDGSLSDTLTVTVTVVPVNDAPVITSLAEAQATEDVYFSYLATATDAEDSTLTWVFDLMPSWLNSAADSVFGVPMEGASDTSFRAIVSDEGLSDTLLVDVSIEAVNDAPLLSDIPSYSYAEEESLRIGFTSWYDYVLDPDNADEELTWDVMGGSYVLLDVTSEDVIIHSPVNWNDTDTIQVFVSDAEYSDTTEVIIVVTPVNDVPEITSLASVSATEDVYFRYVATGTDVEDSTLTWSFTDLPAWLSWDADSVYGTPLEGDFDTSFVAMVSDGELSDTLTVDISVLPVNDPPEIVVDSLWVMHEDTDLVVPYTISDVDGDILELVITEVEGIEFILLETLIQVVPDSNWYGERDLIVSVSDQDTTVYQNVHLSVLPLNDTPYLAQSLDSASIDEDNYGVVVITSLETYFADVDSFDVLTFSKNVLDPGLDSVEIGTADPALLGLWGGDGTKLPVLKRSIVTTTRSASSIRLSDGEDGPRVKSQALSAMNPAQTYSILRDDGFREGDSTSLVVYPTLNFNGSVRIEITATDDSGSYVIDTLILDIQAINDAPVFVQTLYDTSMDEDASLSFPLWASDDDGDSLSYEVYSDTSAVSISYTDSTVWIVPQDNWNGSTMLTFFVSDTGLTTSDTLMLNIYPVNDPPEIVVDSLWVMHEDTDLVVPYTISDVDGDILELVITEVEGIEFILSETLIQVVPDSNWYGERDLIVSVSDQDTTVYQNVHLSVLPLNDTPYLAQSLDSASIDEDNYGVVVITSLETYFADVDSFDVLTFSKNVLDPGLDSVQIGMPDPVLLGLWGGGVTQMPILKRSAVTSKRSASTIRRSNGENVPRVKNLASAGMSPVQTYSVLRDDGFREGDSTSLIVYPTLNFNGSVRIEITATDGSGSYVIDTLILDIQAINDGPVFVQTLYDTSLDEDASASFPLWASDDDGDSLSYEVYSDTSAVSISYTDSTVWIVPQDNWNGSTMLTFFVSDTGLTTSDTLMLTIYPVNDTPESFTLTQPETGTIVAHPDSTEQTFIWEAALDVDEDDILYELWFSSNSWDTTIVEIDTNQYRLNVEDFARGVDLHWSVVASDQDTFTVAVDTSLIRILEIVGVDPELALPDVYVLEQNYPNPFNPTTTIKYGLPEMSDVTLLIYDIRGREIFSREVHDQNAGWYELMWNGRDSHGSPIASGIYLTRMQAGSYTKVIKMLYLK